MTRIIVIGGGQAGASLVARLRSLGFDGSITLICEEDEPPYQRPPLSKKYMLGEFERERLLLRPENWYAENGITLMTGTRCTSVDTNASLVQAGHDSLPYDHLVLATGSVPRRLPSAIGGNLPGVHTVRTVADIDSMSGSIVKGGNLLVVGGGYIGLEAASAAATRGMQVTVIEATSRILMRVAAPETSGAIGQLHAEHGVTIMESAGLARLEGTRTVERAHLDNGQVIPADIVITGIGITPATDLAVEAGIQVDNGIAVDMQGRTSVPNVWAAGDCTSFPWNGRRIRLESVQNAIDQAENIAENILGANTDYQPTPWFWSDQFDAKLQIAGLGTGFTHIVTRPGSRPNMISYWYFREETLLAVDAINDSRSYMIGKRLLELGKTADPVLLANPDANLKQLLRS